MLHIESAIYIDFDNIYTRIQEIYGGVTAKKLAYSINLWITFLYTIGIKELYSQQITRVFQKKVVYLNPVCYSDFRNQFVKSGFRVIDCPPLTLQNKTATDMYMAVDIISDCHTKSYTEYMILSGDADFSPIITHLNEFSKKTLQLSIGPTAKSYKGLSLYQIRSKDFISCLKRVSSYSKSNNFTNSNSNSRNDNDNFISESNSKVLVKDTNAKIIYTPLNKF